MVIQENWVVQELESARHGYKDWKTFAIRSEKTNVCLAIVGEIDRYHENEYKSIAHVMAAAPKLLESLEILQDQLESALFDKTPIGKGFLLGLKKRIDEAIAKTEQD